MQNDDDPEELYSIDELNGKSGFVIAPFNATETCPILLMRPDIVKSFRLKTEKEGTAKETVSKKVINFTKASDAEKQSCFAKASDAEKRSYAEDFDDFHDQLAEGRFDKIVLARCSRITSKTAHEKAEDLFKKACKMYPRLFIALISTAQSGTWLMATPEAVSYTHLRAHEKAEDLFKKACKMYPRLFIALISTAQSGTWLMATPEVLLSGNGCEFKTMALAGTQQAPPSDIIADKPVEGVEWSQKDREEQQYVSDYIEDVLSEFTDHCHKKGPYTTMAAQLYHLRTDFTFRLDDTDLLGEVLDALFPTPAICGIPKEETRQYILANESIDRKYYSGFVGPLMPNGDTHLYVSLRCMNIHPGGKFDLYAGGGLLEESIMKKEWDETEAKMQTMKRVIGL